MIIVRISELRPSEYTYCDLKKIEKLAKDMESKGQLVPITINKDKEIIDGLKRVLAAKELGWVTLFAEEVI